MLLKGQGDDSRRESKDIEMAYSFVRQSSASGHGKDSIVAMSYAVDLVYQAIMRVAWEYYPCISPNGPSGAVSVTDKKPSKTISEVAGTRRSLVSHLTTGIDSPIKAPM